MHIWYVLGEKLQHSIQNVTQLCTKRVTDKAAIILGPKHDPRRAPNDLLEVKM